MSFRSQAEESCYHAPWWKKCLCDIPGSSETFDEGFLTNKDHLPVVIPTFQSWNSFQVGLDGHDLEIVLAVYKALTIEN